MRICSSLLGLFIALVVAMPLAAQSKQQPVRMGCGLMTFDTVPGWGLRPDGKSPLGPTHGAVVIDEAGNIYTSTNQGVFVFSHDGMVIHSYLGKDYSEMHDMEIRKEGDKLVAVGKSAQGERPYDNVTVEGTSITLVITINYEGSPMVITYTGKIDGAKIDGTEIGRAHV